MSGTDVGYAPTRRSYYLRRSREHGSTESRWAYGRDLGHNGTCEKGDMGLDLGPMDVTQGTVGLALGLHET
eukprot:746356-Rhodomonas_salina.2